MRQHDISQSSKSAITRSLIIAGLIIVSLFTFLGLPSVGYASTTPVPVQTATYGIVTATSGSNGNTGQLECSATGCVYIPGPYQYRTNPETPGYINGVYYAWVNGNYYPPCRPDLNHLVSCSGFVNEAPNGCTELVVVIANGYIPENYSYQYYTLHNLSSNSTINGQFVTVSGQEFTGPNTSATGGSCPGTFINVTSLS